MNIIKFRKWYYSLSAVFVAVGVFSILFFGLIPSIDFTGGSRIELRGTQDIPKAYQFGKENNLSGVVVQPVGEDGISIRFEEITEEKQREVSGKVGDFFGEGVSEVGFETVGPTISRELTRNVFLLIGAASLVIILYIAYSFRRVPKPARSWELGVAAVVALVHDAIIVIGAFALLGKFFNTEVNPLFVTGLLTVISFSVHDTVVLFDRVRENLIKKGASDFEGVINLSILEMLPRTITTSFLVWAILLILFVFGGETISGFVLTLLIGVFVGIYSSPLVATPLLVTWQKIRNRKKS